MTCVPSVIMGMGTDGGNARRPVPVPVTPVSPELEGGSVLSPDYCLTPNRQNAAAPPSSSKRLPSHVVSPGLSPIMSTEGGTGGGGMQLLHAPTTAGGTCLSPIPSESDGNVSRTASSPTCAFDFCYLARTLRPSSRPFPRLNNADRC